MFFLYQSMSGDADQGTASFTAKNSSITTNKGDTIFVTNTTATVNLENNTIINNDSEGAFIRIQSGKWGTSGSNGGTVTLKAVNQKIDGDVYVDKISTLDMSLTNGSSYSGTINGDNTAKALAITLDSSSTLTLTGDSYITSLNNELEDNSNINLNGHTLYVNGTSITSTNYKGNSAESTNTVNNSVQTNDTSSAKTETPNTTQIIAYSIIGGAIAILIVILIIKIIKSKKKA